MSRRASLGIDIGGTKTLCLLLDEDLKVVGEAKFKTDVSQGQKRFTAELLASIRQLKRLAKNKGLKLVGVGIGCAGQVDQKKGSIKAAPNVHFLENYPVGRLIHEAAGLECVLGNDVHFGLYGEHEVGAAKGCAHVLGVFFGTGVGGAAIINGQLLEGASGMGGQVGCILAQPVGGPQAALSHGIVDRIASKGSIASEALQMAIKNWAPYLHKRVGSDVSKIGWRMLSKAIRNGDRRVEEMLLARMEVVGIALSNVVNFLNPELLVLGGGLVEELPKLVLNGVGESLRKHLVPEVANVLKIKAGKLGIRAVAVGAGRFAQVELA
jgi:glucokinase